MKFSFKTLTLLICFLATLPSLLIADVRVAGIFGDHMVLQRQKEINVWGWAEPGEYVSIEMDGVTAEVETKNNGVWRAVLPAKEAGGPFQMTVRKKGQEKPVAVFKDVLIGEVWICSGQSNMGMTVSQSKNAAEEIAQSNYPQIRHLKVTQLPSNTPLDDIDSYWNVCGPKTVGSFTAAGYFFGRKLHQELDVPIGLVQSSWGGTRIEPWTPVNGFKNVTALQPIYQRLQMGTLGTPEYQTAMGKHITDTEKWIASAKVKFQANQPVASPPAFPTALTPVPNGRQQPTHLYNGMINGIVGLPIRGAIWYQGESNRVDGMMYYEKKKALVNGWREIWGQGDFPFYWVQIAPFNYGNSGPEVLAELWEAQSKALEIPNTGMAVINDVGDLKDIHPVKKQEVGIRLALLALKNDYGQTDLVASGPTFESLEIGDGRLSVRMGNVGSGLVARDGKPLDWFEIAGEGTGFQKATAEIQGSTIVLSSPNVPKPTAMRFAWNQLAEPNLANRDGLPASSFRAGKVKKVEKIK